MKKRLIYCLAILSILAFQPSLKADEQRGSCLKIAHAMPLNTFEKLMEETYARVGQCITWAKIAPKRQDRLLLEAELDGALLRTKLYIDLWRAIVFSLDTPLMKSHITLIYPKHQRLDCNRESLATKNIGYTSGRLWVKTFFENSDIHTTAVSEKSNILKLLSHGRFNGFAAGKGVNQALMLNAKKERMELNSCVLAPIELYHVVHNRHLHLKPALNAAIKAVMAKSEQQ